MGNKTTEIYGQSPACIGYYLVSKLNDIRQSVSYKSARGDDNVGWFVDELLKTENKRFSNLKTIRRTL